MSVDNPSVEELLRSLRQTVERRAKEANSEIMSNDHIIELKHTVRQDKAEQMREVVQHQVPVDAQVIGFLNQMVEKVVFRVLLENQHLLKDAVEKLLFASSDIKALFAQACEDYFDKRQDFEPMVKDIIEKKIASILRS